MSAPYFITRHLVALGKFTSSFVQNTNFTPLVLQRSERKKHDNDELDLLAGAVNDMCCRLNEDFAASEIAAAALRQSEQRLRNLVEGSIQGLIVDVGGTPKFANQAFADILGFANPAEVLRAESVYEFIHPDERDQILDLRAARQRGEPVPEIVEFRAVRTDGATIWVELRPMIVEWDGEQAIHATLVDITERKHAEQRLRDREEFFKDMAEMSADWFWEMDQDLRYTYISENYSVFKLDPAKLIGKTHEEILGDQYDPDNPSEELLAMRARKPYRGIERLSYANPSRWHRHSARPINSTDGTFLGYRGTSTDITVAHPVPWTQVCLTRRA